MDLSKVDDVTKLKAMAYDQLALRDQALSNLQLITQRIQQVSSAVLDEPIEAAKSTSKK